MCTKCNKIFPNKTKLKRHLEAAKPCDRERELNFQCERCLKKFSFKHVLEYHKNKAKKCKPHSEIVQIENENLRRIVERGRNTTTNNNVTNNETYTLYVYDNKIPTVFNNSLSFKHDHLKEIVNYIEYGYEGQYFNLLSLKTTYDAYNILNNTGEINDLFKILFTNIKNKKGLIFALHKDNTDDIYVKKDLNIIDKLDYGTMLNIIYNVFVFLSTTYKNNFDRKLNKYYSEFVKYYNRGEFSDLNDDKIKNFLGTIKIKLFENLVQLQKNIKIIYSNKDQSIIEQNHTKFINKLKNEKQEFINKNIRTNNNISFSIHDLNQILDRLKTYKKINIYRTKFKLDVYFIISLYEYFMYQLYLKAGIYSNITYKNGELSQFGKNNWEVISINKFVKDLKTIIHTELKRNHISYDEENKTFINTENTSTDDFEPLDDLEYLNWSEQCSIILYLFENKTIKPPKKISNELSIL